MSAEKSWWMERNLSLSNPDAVRLSAAFTGLSQHTPISWEARRKLLAIALNLTEAAIDRALADLKQAGLVREGWVQ